MSSNLLTGLEPNVYNVHPIADLARQIAPEKPRFGHLYCQWGVMFHQDGDGCITRLAELPDGLQAVIVEKLDGIDDGWYVGETRDVQHLRKTLARIETVRLTAEQRQALDDEQARQECLDAEYDDWLDRLENGERDIDHGF